MELSENFQNQLLEKRLMKLAQQQTQAFCQPVYGMRLTPVFGGAVLHSFWATFSPLSKALRSHFDDDQTAI